MNVINLTPHALYIHDREGEKVASIPPSGDVARLREERKKSDPFGDIPVDIVRFSEIENLPDEEPGTIIVVSTMVEQQSSRGDVFSPGSLLRDDDGRITGCVGLQQT